MVAESDAYVALRSPRAEQTADAAATVGRFENASSTRSHSGRGDENPVASVPIEPDKTSSKVSLWELYRFATPRDKAMLAVACVCACINGVLYPCMALVFGHAITAFDPFDRHAVNRAAFEYLAIAVALAVTDYLLFAMFGSLSERQAKALREAVLHRLLHHDVAWFDTHSDAVLQLSSRITSDSIKIKNGMGPKLGDTIKYIGQCAGGFAIGYARCWDLALVMSCVAPVSVVSMSYLVQMIMGLAKTIQTLYAEAGAVAEETLASMRTVASLNGEQRAVERYDAKSRLVEDGTIAVFNRAGFVQGVFTSSSWLMYGIGLWYGGWKVYHSEVPPGTVFQAFFGIILGTWSLGLISPNLTAVVEAQGVAKGLFDLLDESSGIDASRGNGLCPEHVDTGDVVFQDVHFAYPRRPDAPVLRGLNVTIKAGETVAFVGASGGGKSTIVALLERFYDPQVGTITLDGHDLRALNVAWLRGQIGLVSQQPVLFAMSVFDNIAAGATTTPVTQADVEAAARLANAHDFIMALPQQYNTFVGENGTALSGGQKQRIAIARAIVRQPRVLVLDEATSALDNESERVVQDALNNVVESSQQRMATIVIAHRLSTIRAADKIVVMAAGHVAESGTHTELMGRDGGVYKTMVEMQAMEESESDAVEVWTPLEEVVEKERVSEKGRPSSTTASVSEEKEASADASSDGSPQVDNESNFTVWDAMKLSAPEAKYYAVGMAAAVVHGLSPPCSALLVSAVAAMLTETYGEFLVLGNRHALNQIAPSVRTYGIYYLLGACVVGGAHCLQVRCFRLMAAKLTRRLRHLHFQSMCRQDIAFFDDPAHSTGALTSDLAIQANKVASVSGDAQSKMLQAATTLLAAVAVACTSGNAVLTLIVVLILPFIVVGEVVRANYANGKMVVIDDLSKAGSEASQALNNIRTVMAFGLEQQMCGRYAVALEDPLVKGRKDTRFTGLAVGYSSFVLFATYALVFWYGGVLVDKHEITFRELIRTLMAIILSAQAVGFAASWVAESKHALAAGGVIFTVRDRPHAIDALREEDGRTLDTVQGRLELRNVSFRYPTRPEVSVLSNFNLTIEANETIGFCGTSGGGKSTIVALLERFYDPLDGQVLLDGHDLKELRVSWLRRQIGYVGQEPTLFVGTIAENIAYGLGYALSQDEIERVARLANAHDFITKLPDGYTTQVGARGELLSGGQKQRIAIARAVLRNPRFLILDEATSALDSASERVVQEALDSVVATQQCTTVVIAHRLSTLRGADRICVVDQGRVAELGSHEELLRRDGLYARLLNGGDVREELRA